MVLLKVSSVEKGEYPATVDSSLLTSSVHLLLPAFTQATGSSVLVALVMIVKKGFHIPRINLCVGF